MGKQLKKYAAAGLQLRGINYSSLLESKVSLVLCWVREWVVSGCYKLLTARARERDGQRERVMKAVIVSRHRGRQGN